MTPPRLSVLILCTGNSARSQLAEVILRQLSQGKIDVESAGSAPQPQIHPMARESARRLLNVEMDGQYPKRLDQFLDRRFDYVITVCDRASETCPFFPGGPQRLHWSFEDPAAALGSDESRQGAFDDVTRGLVKRVHAWLTLPEISRAIESGTKP